MSGMEQPVYDYWFKMLGNTALYALPISNSIVFVSLTFALNE